MSLSMHAARPLRCLNRSAGQHAFLLPTRSLTRLQRGRVVARGSNPQLSLGSPRHLSLWPWAGSSPKPEVQVPSDAVVKNEVLSSEQPAESIQGDSTVPSAPPEVATLSSTSPPTPTPTESVVSSLSDTAVSVAATATPPADLASLGLTGFSPAGLCVSALAATQALNIPWWGSIAIFTIGARAFLFPLLVSAQRTQGRLAPIQSQLAELREEMTAAQRDKDLLKLQQTGMKQRNLMRTANVNPVAPLFNGVMQMSVQLGAFLGVRKVCLSGLESIKDGGFGWILDLSAADPFYILPVLNTALANWQLFLSRRDSMASGNPNAVHILNGMRIVSVLTLPVVMSLPAGVNFHITASLLLVSLQTILLHRPAIRSKLGLPELPLHTKEGLPTLRDTFAYAKEALGKRYENAQIEAAVKEEERQRKLRLVTKKR